MQIDFVASPTITAFMNSDARHRFITGPFGSGKTTGTIFEIVRRASMQRPSPIDGKRKTRIAIVRNTAPQLNDTVLKSFLSWFPSGTLGIYKSTGKTYSIRQGDIECDIIFRALDDEGDLRNLLSLELTMAELSEFRELPRAIVEGLDGRVGRFPPIREGGPTFAGIFGDSNMPDQDTYWWAMMEGYDPDDLKTKKENGWKIFRQPAAMLRHEDGTFTLNPEAENTEHLPPDYYQNLVVGKGTDYVRTFVMCEYGQSRGGKPVHPMFNRDAHVAKGPLNPDKNSLLVVSADFGLTPAVTLLQQDAFGRLLVLDELAEFDMGIERLIESRLLPLIRRKYDGFEIFVTGDPSGDNRSQSDESSCVDVFKRYKRKGLGRVKMAYSNNPVHRIGALDYFLSRLVDRGRPALQIDPSCVWLIQALGGRYAYPVDRKGKTKDSPEKNEWSHVAEAAQYGAMYFERGGRRKAEQKEQDWSDLARSQGNTGYNYASPR